MPKPADERYLYTTLFSYLLITIGVVQFLAGCSMASGGDAVARVTGIMVGAACLVWWALALGLLVLIDIAKAVVKPKDYNAEWELED